MKNFKYFAFALVALTGLGLQSCHSDDYDVKGNPDNLVYVAANATNSYECAVVQTPVGSFGSVSAKFPVKSLRSLDATTTITPVIDYDMVDTYNEDNGTDYIALPTSIPVTITKATILNGEAVCSDSIVVSVDDSYLPQLTASGYVVPFRISDVSGDSSAKASEERGFGYLVITTSEKLINDGGTVDDMPGTELSTSEISDWTITIGDWSSLIDDNVWTGENYSEGTPFTIDMQKTYKVGGLRFQGVYVAWYGTAYAPYDITMELSEDGNTWTSCGTASRDIANFSDGYFNICLYGAVPARYIRLTVTPRISWAASVVEIRVVAQ